jgi:hypothetical protein
MTPPWMLVKVGLSLIDTFASASVLVSDVETSFTPLKTGSQVGQGRRNGSS